MSNCTIPHIKVIGVGSFGELTARYVSANIFENLEDKPVFLGNELKYVFAGNNAHSNSIQALLTETDVAIIIGDNTESAEMLSRIATECKQKGIFAVLLVKSLANEAMPLCDCIIAIENEIEALNAASLVIHPCYCIGIVEIDWQDVENALANSGECLLINVSGANAADELKAKLEAINKHERKKAASAVLNVVFDNNERFSCLESFWDIVEDKLGKDCSVVVNAMPATNTTEIFNVSLVISGMNV